MSTPNTPPASVPHGSVPHGSVPHASVWLARDMSVAWWYTVGAVLFFEVMLVFTLAATLLATHLAPFVGVVVGVGGCIWIASTYLLLADYRHRADALPGLHWVRVLAPILVAAAFGITAGVLTGSWLFALFALAQSLTLLNWQPGVRLRVILGLTVVLACAWLIDSRLAFIAEGRLAGLPWWLPAFYMTFLPIMTVTTLWWWDVLTTLDRARTSEAKLAAAQERLRVATDVHDLQGHHLQVIALQLELAERLTHRDADASLEQLRAARRSVEEAVQGTRDLALQFRSVPLQDELANAVDLLRAAGLSVEASIDARANHAPAATLGPVIRETTTNVLRHGTGTRARLTLTDSGSDWQYEISNDRVPSTDPHRAGSGLEGIERRVAEADGSLEVREHDTEFIVVVTVPKRWEEAR